MSKSDYGYAKDGKVYLNGYFDFPTREIGVVKESEEASIQYFTKRFDLAKEKVAELTNAVHTTPNKGSFLMKLIHLREYLAKFDGLGDFPELFATLDTLEVDINGYVEKNRVKNLEIKQALLKEAEEYRGNGNWIVVTKKYKELKLKWIKTGSAFKADEEILNEKFDAIVETFFQKRNKVIEEKRRIMQERLDRYAFLLEKLKDVITHSPENAFQIIKRIQNDWKMVGKIPKKEFVELTTEYKGELNKFFGKRKQQQPFKNPGDRKREICEKVEKMVDMEEPPIDEVKNLQKEWQRLGKFKHPNDKEFNTRFKIACNELFESHFLTKQARYKFEGFDEKTFFEQLKIKIRLIKESIKKDETELSLMNERTKHTPMQRYDPKQPPQPFDIERLNQINKLKTKQRILKKLQDQLLANY
jgi:hypothetical protein